MTFGKKKISKALEEAKNALEAEKGLSASFRTTMELLIVIVRVLVNRLGLNSTNSSKPPSSDPKPKKKRKKRSSRKPGGQEGHRGSRLEPVSDPDHRVDLKIDRRTLPRGDYTEVEPETRQVFDIEINRIVTEYSAQVLVDSDGNRFVAEFPAGVSQKTQYGPGLKAQVVYDSQSQLIPYDRIAEDLADNAEMPISTGSVFNFVKEAYNRLEQFDAIARQVLVMSSVLHADETGINIGGKRVWLHSCSNEQWTLFMPHEKRGSEAMDAMAILPSFEGILCHDHWKPYLSYTCEHSLCNAHHLRELERANEQDGWKWAADLKQLLEAANSKKITQDGQLSSYFRRKFRSEYRDILERGDREMPPPNPPTPGKRGKPKQSKSRNLLERLRDYEKETLRFMDSPEVPFTNNQGERDIRMTKVQQKISGCFRSEDGAKHFCRIRSFISTCRKQGISPAKALKDLFLGKLPDFLT